MIQLVNLFTSMQGLVPEDAVKDCASRLFTTRMILGEFDPPEMNPYRKYVKLNSEFASFIISVD